jgi:hypothetical protein
MKFGVIKALVGQHPMRKLCRVFGVRATPYYAARKKEERPRASDNVHLARCALPKSARTAAMRAKALFQARGRSWSDEQAK